MEHEVAVTPRLRGWHEETDGGDNAAQLGVVVDSEPAGHDTIRSLHSASSNTLALAYTVVPRRTTSTSAGTYRRNRTCNDVADPRVENSRITAHTPRRDLSTSISASVTARPGGPMRCGAGISSVQVVIVMVAVVPVVVVVADASTRWRGCG